MTKIILNAEDLTAVHIAILEKFNECHQGAGDDQSRLTASGIVTLLSRVLPEEMKTSKAIYAKAVSELRSSGWIVDNSCGRTAGLVRYWPSEKAQEFVLSQLTPV